MHLRKPTNDETFHFIRGGGEMGALTRSFDWSLSPIGTPDQWQQSLRTSLGIVLHSAFPMFLFWGEHLICFYNDAFRPSLGVDGKHPALGKKGNEVWSEIWDFVEPLLRQVMTTGEPVWYEDQLVPFFRNGRIEDIYWTFSYSPVYDDHGDISGVFVTCTEVTDAVLNRMRTDEIVAERTRELATANHSLQRSNAELAQFAYIASHDLQEPIRKVATFTQMLETALGTTSERQQHYIGKIKNASARMLLLIRDVLTFSQLSRDTDLVRITDLNLVIDNVVDDLELLIDEKRARVHYEGLPVLEAVPLQMAQLFGNLISNALKFSREEADPVISISVKLLDRPALTEFPMLDNRCSYHHLRVSDNGIGFDQLYADQIFEIFQRLHGKKEFEGTGIGLAMCKKILQNHHGHIFATSEEGQGATFHVILPENQSSFEEPASH
ncbi:sensor histidine kinase [Dyadobacter beijingensis]|nr:ATP-binding protein [Dyadobacter beijingensis]